MTWTTLSRKDAAAFIQSVADPDETIIFDPSICNVHKMPLDFYDGYHLVRIGNQNMLPILVMDYLSDGTNHYYLDGSDAAFHTLNAKGAINLTKQNIVDYLDLYISYVYERGNSLQFPRIFDVEPPEYDKENEAFILTTPLIYHGKTIQAQLTITKRGTIIINDPFNVSYLDTLTPPDTISYRHPYEAQVIEQSKMLLYGSSTAESLLEMAKKENIPIRVLSNPNYQSYITNQPILYICMPAAEQNAKYMQALCLIAGLRDAKQILAGYLHHHPNETQDVYLASNIGKNLDMGIEMCKIVRELEEQGITEAISDLKALGLGPLYEGFISGKTMDDLYDILLQIFEKEEIIVRV